MFKTNQQKFILVFALNSVIALCYYINNLDAYYSELSSDIQNIIPVAQKFDDPSLFKKDLYLDDLDNVRYYTPFYVQSLRFIAKFTNYNYVQAVNILGCICHLLFGILWFFLIYKFSNDFWISLLLSVFIRGIVWLPGLEIWGISGLWSIMPRTVYITLMPIPFLVLSVRYGKLFLSSFLIGLIFNFHPITGLGGILLYLTLLSLQVILYRKKTLLNFKIISGVLLTLLLGMLPFIVTYFSKTSSTVNYNIVDYNVAFNRRIPDYFSNSIYFLKQWFNLKNLTYVIPLLAYLWFSKSNKDTFIKAKMLLFLAIVLLIVPLLSIPLEKCINYFFDKNIRMSFQLVRMQKVVILPGVMAIAFLLKMLSERFQKVKKLQPFIFLGYLILLSGSHSKFVDRVPFIGDDISRQILPHNLSFSSHYSSQEAPADRMARFISDNTSKEALFCASSGFYRGSAKRSVTLDSKGASMIIEGNPTKFIQWSKQQKKVMKMTSMDDVIVYLKSLGIDYYITSNTSVNAEMIHQEGRLILYKL